MRLLLYAQDQANDCIGSSPGRNYTKFYTLYILPFSMLGTMKTIYHTISTVIIISFHLLQTTSAFAISHPQTFSKNDTLSTPLTASNLQCSKTAFLSPWYLTLHACALAISELPSSTETGIFHAGQPYDAWSLPVTETAGRCKIIVDMNVQAMRDRTSWLAIGVKASDLNSACADKLKYRYGGGWATVGDDRGIVVKLGLVSKVEEDQKKDAGNGTAEEAAAVN